MVMVTDLSCHICTRLVKPVHRVAHLYHRHFVVCARDGGLALDVLDLRLTFEVARAP